MQITLYGFPFWRGYQVVDGRKEVKGHGTRDMPIWGQTFRLMEGGDEDAVRGRIWQLLYDLQTLQRRKVWVRQIATSLLLTPAMGRLDKRIPPYARAPPSLPAL